MKAALALATLALTASIGSQAAGGSDTRHAIQPTVSQKRVKSTALPTASQIVADVAAAAKLKVAPRDLQPPANAVAQYGGFTTEQQRCDSMYSVSDPPLCQIGDPKAAKSIVIWGDSHAAMWMPALQAIALHIHARLYVFAKASCPPSEVEPVQPQTANLPYISCTKFKDKTLADIAKIHPALVILTGAFKAWSYISAGKAVAAGSFTSTTWIPNAAGEQEWDRGLTSTLTTLKPLAKRVVVLGDIAYPLEDGAECLSAHAEDLQACTASRSEAVYAAHNADEKATTERAGDTYVPVVQWMCTTTTCPPVIDHYAVYFDSYNITCPFSDWLADAVGVDLGLLPTAKR